MCSLINVYKLVHVQIQTFVTPHLPSLVNAVHFQDDKKTSAMTPNYY